MRRVLSASHGNEPLTGTSLPPDGKSVRSAIEADFVAALPVPDAFFPPGEVRAGDRPPFAVDEHRASRQRPGGDASSFRKLDTRSGEEIRRVVPDILQHRVLREEYEAEGVFRSEAVLPHLLRQIRNDVFHRLGVVV